MNLSEKRSLVWRPLQIALIVSVLSAERTNTEASFSPSPQSFEGRRCCGDNEVFTDNGCVSSGSTDVDFTPSVYFSNDSDATSLGIVDWRVKPLNCIISGRMKLEYHNVDGNESRLELSDDKVILRWKEYLIFKRTAEYCVDRQHDQGYAAVICRIDIEEVCSGATCVQKCCGEEEVLRLNGSSCIHNPDKKDLVYDFRSLTGRAISVSEDLVVVNRMPTQCKSLHPLNPQHIPLQGYYLLQNGNLYEEDTGTRHHINRYCLVHVFELSTDVAFVCKDPEPKAIQVKRYLTATGFVISVVFLVVTIICNLMIPHLRDVQSLSLVAYMAALLVANCTGFTSFVFSDVFSNVHCIVNGMLLQLSLLATFFWLNVMCFDIWRIIRATVQLIPLTGIFANNQMKFKLYSVYAWGVPLIITTVSITIHYVPDEHRLPGILHPAYGVRTCFLSDSQ